MNEPIRFLSINQTDISPRHIYSWRKFLYVWFAAPYSYSKLDSSPCWCVKLKQVVNQEISSVKSDHSLEFQYRTFKNKLNTKLRLLQSHNRASTFWFIRTIWTIDPSIAKLAVPYTSSIATIEFFWLITFSRCNCRYIKNQMKHLNEFIVSRKQQKRIRN